MTLPCQRLPNTTYFVTRGCVGREFALHGAKAVQEIWEYLFAVGCQETGIVPIGYMVMSNHVHYMVHDPKGNLPELTSFVHGMVARAVNSYRGRVGTFWEREETNQPEVPDADKIVDMLAYALVNPVRAGAVPFPHQWPGAKSRVDDYGKTRVLQRPKTRFFRRSSLPAQVTLRLEVPPSHAHLGPEGFSRLLREAVDAKVKAIHEARRESGKGFAGLDAIRAIPWTHRATSKQPQGRGQNHRPRVLASSRELREAVLARIFDFRVRYNKALDAFRAGQRDVVFPEGTYRFAVQLGLRRHPPP